MIPLFSPLRQNEPMMGELRNAVLGVLESGNYILGPEVERLENELKLAVGYEHAIGCASGTEALVLALRALDLPPDSEVITSAFSFVASSNCVVWAGLRPSLADISPETFCVTADDIEACLTPKTKAVIAVDLYGRQVDVASIRALCEKHHLFLIEDGAQSIGVSKSRADFYTTSFYPTKNIGAIGDAGAVFTDNAKLATRVRELSRHGGLIQDEYPFVGTTARMDTLQAAVVSAK